MIHHPETIAAITALHEQYEAALMANDIEKLTSLFWDSPDALRFGVQESLYGSEQIGAFRRNRPTSDLARVVSNLKIVTFEDNCAIVTLEFDRTVEGVPRHGRQTQVWRRFGDDWKIVSAHVSLTPVPYIDLAAPLLGLVIPPELRDGVRQNIARAAVIARPLLEMQLDDAVEASPVFAA